MSARVSVRLHGQDGEAIAVKTATTVDEAAALTHEAALLRRAGHPGVVSLVGQVVTDDGAELHTRFAGEPLDRWRGNLARLAGLGAAVAATLADLHELGIVHGRLDGSHVLLGADGRPRLCGLSPGSDAEPPDDIAALGRLLGSLAEQIPLSDRRGLLAWRRGPLAERRAFDQLIAHATDPVPTRRPSARAFATSLLAAVTDAELPPAGVVEPGEDDRPSPARPAAATVAADPGEPADAGDTGAAQGPPTEPPRRARPEPGHDAPDHHDEAPRTIQLELGIDPDLDPRSPDPVPDDRSASPPDRDRNDRQPGVDGDNDDGSGRPPRPPGRDHAGDGDDGSGSPPHHHSRDDVGDDDGFALSSTTGGRQRGVDGDSDDGSGTPGQGDSGGGGGVGDQGPAPGRRGVEWEPYEDVLLIGGDDDLTDPGWSGYDDVFGDQRQVGVDDVFADRPWPGIPDPMARLRRPSRHRRPRGRGHRLLSQAAALVGAVMAFTALLVGLDGSGPREASTDEPLAAPRSAPEPGPCPPDGTADASGDGDRNGPDGEGRTGSGGRPDLEVDVDGDGCPEPVLIDGGVVEVAGERWSVGRPGDEVTFGDWDCDGAATPAVYRPATGDVFLFPTWATPGQPLTVEPVAQVAGGRALSMAPAATASGGCDTPVVELTTGALHTVEIDQ